MTSCNDTELTLRVSFRPQPEPTPKGLEVDLMDEVLKSRRTAWMVATGSAVVTVFALSLVGYVVHKYSQPIPAHLLTLNEATHEVQQVKLTRDQTSYGDEIDKFWLTQYVIHRESYDFYSVQVDYTAVGLMSTPNVAESYQSKFKGRNGLDKVLGDSETTRVKINSVILDKPHGVATIRFTTVRRVRSNPVDDQPQRWIAIMGYEYKSLAMNAEQRYVNPLGFRVTSYRVNPEVN
ncbi:type IV secretion system protein [Klebsiella michiganensis]|uniref:virB8 family protein n=1 Tax=Klebsiella michiganensis TaxID=1134687 RepID=UPI003862227A